MRGEEDNENKRRTCKRHMKRTRKEKRTGKIGISNKRRRKRDSKNELR